MALERTLSIIKPDATRHNLTGAINAMIEKAGLRIVAQRRIRMRAVEAVSTAQGTPLTWYGLRTEQVAEAMPVFLLEL